MRIWAFPSFYPYDRPGQSFLGTFAHFQYKGLIANGADLNVVLPVLWHPPFPFSKLHPQWKESEKMHYPKSRVYDGIKVYHPRISNMKPNRFVKKTILERYVASIVAFFSENNITLDPSIDVFYSQWLPDSVFVQIAAHQLGVRSAVLAIGDDVIVWPGSNNKNFDAFKKLLLESDLPLANADYLMREAEQIIDEKLPYKIVYFGVDYNQFKPIDEAGSLRSRKKYGLPADKIVILTVGSALVRKGWLDLFDALVEIKKTNSEFVIAAVHGGLKDIDLIEEVNKRDLTDQFVNVGEIPPNRLNEIYNAADIFCLPSHWEGLATVVIESMSSGLPVITTNICGHPEAISSGLNGILVPPKDHQVLAREIQALINDKEKRTELGKNARKFIVEKWGNYSDNAAKLKIMLEELLVKK